MRWYGPCERADYYTQRNNPPPETAALQCNVTAIVTMLAGSGVKLPDTKSVQPEVALAAFASSDKRVLDYMRKHHQWAIGAGWLPYTESATLTVATNLWLGADVVDYSRGVSLETVAADLAGGRCSVGLGRFTPGGHFVAIVGVQTDQFLDGGPETRDIHLDAIGKWMVHDPWGDWHTGYKDHNGARGLFTTQELMRLLIDYDKPTKWIHSVRKVA